MQNCCDSMLKVVVFLFNFVFFISGVALISIGAYIQVKMSDYFDFVGDNYSGSSVAIIAIGVVVFIVAFFGCCGACTENSCMMKTYAFLLMVILIAELGISITIFIYKDKADTLINDDMKKGMDNYSVEGHEGVQKAWDVLQQDVKCCGVKDYKDWFTSKHLLIPESCCKTIDKNCKDQIPNFNESTSEEDADKFIYTNGCYSKLKSEIEDNALVVGGVGIGLVVIQIFGIIIACCLGKNMAAENNFV